RRVLFRSKIYNERCTFLENNTLPRNWVIFYFCSHVCCTATSACICERIFCIPIGSDSHFIINYYRVDYWSHHLRNFIRSYGTDSIYQPIFVRIRYPIFHHAISRFFSHFTRTSSSTRVRFSWTSSCLAGLYSRRNRAEECGGGHRPLYIKQCPRRDDRTSHDRLLDRSLFVANCFFCIGGGWDCYCRSGICHAS